MALANDETSATGCMRITHEDDAHARDHVKVLFLERWSSGLPTFSQPLIKGARKKYVGGAVSGRSTTGSEARVSSEHGGLRRDAIRRTTVAGAASETSPAHRAQVAELGADGADGMDGIRLRALHTDDAEIAAFQEAHPRLFGS